MGDRALIITEEPKNGQCVPAIYVHWEGNIGIITGVLNACRFRQYRDPKEDSSYALARILGVLHELTGVEQSGGLGITMYDGNPNNVPFDNGVYLIGENFEIEKHFGPDFKNIEDFETNGLFFKNYPLTMTESESELAREITENIIGDPDYQEWLENE